MERKKRTIQGHLPQLSGHQTGIPLMSNEGQGAGTFVLTINDEQLKVPAKHALSPPEARDLETGHTG